MVVTIKRNIAANGCNMRVLETTVTIHVRSPRLHLRPTPIKEGIIPACVYLC
jgi:hypothetical protein